MEARKAEMIKGIERAYANVIAGKPGAIEELAASYNEVISEFGNKWSIDDDGVFRAPVRRKSNPAPAPRDFDPVSVYNGAYGIYDIR